MQSILMVLWICYCTSRSASDSLSPLLFSPLPLLPSTPPPPSASPNSLLSYSLRLPLLLVINTI